MDRYLETLPLLQALRNPAMQERHWREIIQITGCPLKFESETFQLRELMTCPLLPNRDAIDDVCVAAVKEVEIERILAKIIAEWYAENGS